MYLLNGHQAHTFSPLDGIDGDANHTDDDEDDDGVKIVFKFGIQDPEILGFTDPQILRAADHLFRIFYPHDLRILFPQDHRIFKSFGLIWSSQAMRFLKSLDIVDIY